MSESTGQQQRHQQNHHGFTIPPKSEWTLISQGAEARVWKFQVLENKEDDDDDGILAPRYIICKERFSKSYRHPDLDARLTKSRCRSEAKILDRCRGIDKKKKSKKNQNQQNQQQSQQDTDEQSFKKQKLTTDKSNNSSSIDDDNDRTVPTDESNNDNSISANNNNTIRVPAVLRVQPPSLFLEFMDGPSVKTFLQERQSQNEQQQKQVVDEKMNVPPKTNDSSVVVNHSQVSIEQLADQIGQVVGRMHNLGIIHGDLTTSNMMMIFDNPTNTNNDGETEGSPAVSSSSSSSSFEVCPIDFGLAKISSSVEEQAVDLYVLERALESTHPELPSWFFHRILTSYQTTTTPPPTTIQTSTNTNSTDSKKVTSTQSTLDRLEQVRMRGRKRECFG